MPHPDNEHLTLRINETAHDPRKDPESKDLSRESNKAKGGRAKAGGSVKANRERLGVFCPPF